MLAATYRPVSSLDGTYFMLDVPGFCQQTVNIRERGAT